MTIPLGIPDLAAGLIRLAIFEQTGFLAPMMHAFGPADGPVSFLGSRDKGTIVRALMLAGI